MKIYTSSIVFDKIENVTALRGVVRKWYPLSDPGCYAVVSDNLIVTNNFKNDTDDVLAMVAFIGNAFSRSMNIHFGELNFPDYSNFQNGERVATTPSDNSASADGIG